MLFCQFENKKIESVRDRKKTLKLVLIVCKLLDVFTTYDSCLTFIPLHVVLCALHELNYNLKVVILAIVI